MAVLRETKLQNFKINCCISIRRRTHAKLQVTLYSAMIDIFLLTQTLAVALASNSLLLGFQCGSKLIRATKTNVLGKGVLCFFPFYQSQFLISRYFRSVADCSKYFLRFLAENQGQHLCSKSVLSHSITFKIQISGSTSNLKFNFGH